MNKFRNLSKRLSTRASIATLAVLSIGTATAGSAYAAWAVSGTGSLSGTSTTAKALTVTATMTGPLYPGSLNAVSLNIGNPNVFPVVASALSFGSVTSSEPTDCPAVNVIVTPPASINVAIPAGGNASSTIPGLATMLLTAPAGCQGVTFTLNATVTGAAA